MSLVARAQFSLGHALQSIAYHRCRHSILTGEISEQNAHKRVSACYTTTDSVLFLSKILIVYIYCTGHISDLAPPPLSSQAKVSDITLYMLHDVTTFFYLQESPKE